jgi:hypothetical protein
LSPIFALELDKIHYDRLLPIEVKERLIFPLDSITKNSYRILFNDAGIIAGCVASDIRKINRKFEMFCGIILSIRMIFSCRDRKKSSRHN